MTDEILQIKPSKLPKDYFDTKGKLISYRNEELRVLRKLKKISGVNPELLGKS